MKKIDKDNLVFQSDSFMKDQYMFNIILKNLDSPSLELYTDEESYIICRGSKEWPTWIWTKDGLAVEKVKEIEALIERYLTESPKDKFTCKKELYDLLVARGFDKLNLEDYFEMGFLVCRRTIEPKACDGKLSFPIEEDKNTLVKYWYDDCQEMNDVNPITIEQAKEDVEKFFDSGTFYVFRNVSGKIVCMASYSLVGNQAKINHVYTPLEERKKGYAANLIYHMTNHLLEKGYVPLLYTDYNYAASNKAYINAGYDAEGILINFSCSKEKKKYK